MAELEFLFAYGSLQNEDVQLATLGRRLAGASDELPGYRQAKIAVRDAEASPTGENYYLNAQFTGRTIDAVAGMVFKVTAEELAQADLYEEPADYQRIRVLLRSGQQAWVYVNVTADEL